MVIDDTLNHRDCSSKANTREAADTDVYKNCANHDCFHSLSPPLIKEIIIVISCKVRFSRSLTTKRLTITNLLQIVKTAGDALITRAVESVEADAGTTVDSRVNLRASEDRIAVCIYDARSRSGVGIYKVAASVSRVVRSFKISVTKRSLKYGKCRYRLAVALELGFTFTICSLDRVKSKIATNFRRWATERLKEYMIKGFTMDDERLKNLGGGNYWKELLDRIRDIRSSEKVMYRQVLWSYVKI